MVELRQAGALVHEMEVTPPDLEEIFVKIVGGASAREAETVSGA